MKPQQLEEQPLLKQRERTQNVLKEETVFWLKG